MLPISYLEAGPFSEVELMGKTMLFTELRVDRKSLPDGIFAYDLRHTDEDWGIPCEIQKHVLVNHFGCVLTDEEINLGEHGFIDFDEDDFCYTDSASVQAIDVAKYFGPKSTSSVNVIEKETKIMTNNTIDEKTILQNLLTDPNTSVRAALAKYGYRLDVLINDANWLVRREVAEKGYGLEKLINDFEYLVRAEVAKQGYGLEKLISDPNFNVRAEVAKQGYGLDMLSSDPHFFVRREVAKICDRFLLKRLSQDEDPTVRSIAIHRLDEENEEK